MGRLLSRDEILGAEDIRTEEVAVPEWGGSVLVRGLSGAERDSFEAAVVERRGKKVDVKLQNVRARLVALSVVDEEGERLFSEKDVQALGQKSASALQRVFDAASRLSGLSEEDIEELEKNSENVQGSDSGSS